MRVHHIPTRDEPRIGRITCWYAFKFDHLECGQNLGLFQVAYPRSARYSIGLREPSEILVRSALYQRMYESTSAMKCSMVVLCQLPA